MEAPGLSHGIGTPIPREDEHGHGSAREHGIDAIAG